MQIKYSHKLHNGDIPVYFCRLTVIIKMVKNTILQQIGVATLLLGLVMLFAGCAKTHAIATAAIALALALSTPALIQAL
jgi:hypothetical protein